MKLNIPKPSDKLIGAQRVSQRVWEKLEKLSKEKGVTKQEIVKHILENIIDDIE